MSDQQSFSSSDGFEVTSSHETPQEIQQSLFGDSPAKVESPNDDAPDQSDDVPETEKPDQTTQTTQTAPAAQGDKPVGKNNKTRHDPTERVKQALREKKEAQEYAAYARKERDEISARADAAQTELNRLKESMSPKSAPEGKPKSDDFETWEEYTEALTSWKVDEIRKSERDTQVKAQVEQTKTGIFKDFEKRMGAKIQADPTIRDRISDTVLQLRPLSVLRDGERPGPLNLLAEQFLRSPASAELMVYFSDNESELQRFSTLHPLRFGVELGKIEARFVADAPNTATAQVETSKAKPPVRPVTGGPATGEREPSDDASFDDHVKYHNAKDRVSYR